MGFGRLSRAGMGHYSCCLLPDLDKTELVKKGASIDCECFGSTTFKR
jgi:hypothetical protein